LVSARGTRIQLVSGLRGANLTNTVLDDAAATVITSGSAPYTGTFRPVGNISALEGQALRGTWTLEIVDATRRNAGTLGNWSLIVEWAAR
jgi:subtilisin-like proprotein convertase family protein